MATQGTTSPPSGGDGPGPERATMVDRGRRAAALSRWWHGLDTVTLPTPDELDPILDEPAALGHGEDDDAIE